MAGSAFIGDVFIISQLASKVGCAFEASQAGTPDECTEVDNQLKSLNAALESLADILEDDTNLLTNANDKTQAGVSKVLVSCRQTLQDLDSFVGRCRDVSRAGADTPSMSRKPERSWKRLLTKTGRPTNDGDHHHKSLRDILQLHTRSVSLTTKAVQSKSLSHLDNTVAGLALQVDEVQSLATDLKNTTIESKRNPVVSPKKSPSSGKASPEIRRKRLQRPPPKGLDKKPLPPEPKGAPAQKANGLSGYGSQRKNSVVSALSQRTPALADSDWDLVSEPPGVSTASSASTPYSEASHLVPRRLQVQKPEQASRSRKPSGSSSGSLLSSTTTEPTSYSGSSQGNVSLKSQSSQSRSGSDSGGPASRSDSALARPLQPLNSVTRSAARSRPRPRAAIHPSSSRPDQSAQQLPYARKGGTRSPVEEHSSRVTRFEATISQHQAFETKLWRNAVPLCEVTATWVEFAEWNIQEMDYCMVTATSKCQMYLVQKQEERPNGEPRRIVSLWALSDDRQVRMQQKLHEWEAVLPYTVWGATNKVSLRLASVLEFHDVVSDAPPASTVETSWVNYVFEDEAASNMFQSALMGKTLTASIKTHKTIGFFEDVAGQLSLQEQICGLENLRLWQDPETNGVQAMVHLTPEYKDEYLIFHLNSQRQPIRLRDESPRAVKISGLHITLEPINESAPGRRANSTTALVRPPRTSSLRDKKVIRAVLIEFSSEDDKLVFLSKLEEAQGFYFAG